MSSITSKPADNNFKGPEFAFRPGQFEISACGVDQQCAAPQETRVAALNAAEQVNDFNRTLSALGEVAKYALPVAGAAAVGIGAAAGVVSAPVVAAGAFAGVAAAFLNNKGHGRG